MGEFTTQIELWMRERSGWAPLVVSLLTFLESLPGISLLVPATALLLATGALLGAGALDPASVLAAAISGAILGDAVGFWVSRAYGPRAVRQLLPRSQRRAYARALLLFRRWGWAAVFIGRFLGPIRAVAPLMAGVARMRERHFQAANVASAVVWAPAMLMPGYAAAIGLEHAEAAEPHILFGAGLILIGGLAVLMMRRFRRRSPSTGTNDSS